MGDDAAADGELDPTVSAGEGANENAAVDVPVEAGVEQAATIRTSNGRFQFGDDFHSADFGGAGDRSAGKDRLE